MAPVVKQVTVVRPELPELIERGLRCLLGGPAAANATAVSPLLVRRMEALRYYGQVHQLDIHRQVLAVLEDQIVAACLWVNTPGRVASLYITDPREHPQVVPALSLCIAGAVHDAQTAGLSLAQAIVEEQDHGSAQAYRDAGCEYLATLLYMERSEPWLSPRVVFPSGVSLETYGVENHGQFCRAIEESYVGALDCPRLTGLRSIEDVVRGHKAVGRFREDLWFLLRRDREPIGVLLLAEVEARESLEVVYLGLAPEMRGRGLGTALMQLALRQLAANSLRVCTVAVDATNTPAMALYRKMRFRKRHSRDVYIKALNPIGTAAPAGGL